MDLLLVRKRLSAISRSLFVATIGMSFWREKGRGVWLLGARCTPRPDVSKDTLESFCSRKRYLTVVLTTG